MFLHWKNNISYEIEKDENTSNELGHKWFHDILMNQIKKLIHVWKCVNDFIATPLETTHLFFMFS
jgi:hypothetical protein